jgi:hypothetical protein
MMYAIGRSRSRMVLVVVNKRISDYLLHQWFPDFLCARTTYNILVLREAQNIHL